MISSIINFSQNRRYPALHKKGDMVVQKSSYTYPITLISILILSLAFNILSDNLIIKNAAYITAIAMFFWLCRHLIVCLIAPEKKFKFDLKNRRVHLCGGRTISMNSIIGIQTHKEDCSPTEFNIKTKYQLFLLFDVGGGRTDRECLLTTLDDREPITLLARQYESLCGIRVVKEDWQ